MKPQRRLVRRIDPNHPAAFDEQLWPVQVALMVLAGVTAFLVIAAGGWNDPRWTHNGWIRLVTLAATCIALAWGFTTISPKRSRRLQFAVLVSLVAHSVLAVALSNHCLRQFIEETAPDELLAVDTPVELEEIEIQAPPDEQIAEFEKPFELPALDPILDTASQEDESELPENVWRPEIEEVDPVEPWPASAIDREISQERPRRADDLAKLQRHPRAQPNLAAAAENIDRATQSIKNRKELAATATFQERQFKDAPTISGATTGESQVALDALLNDHRSRSERETDRPLLAARPVPNRETSIAAFAAPKAPQADAVDPTEYVAESARESLESSAKSAARTFNPEMPHRVKTIDSAISVEVAPRRVNADVPTSNLFAQLPQLQNNADNSPIRKARRRSDGVLSSRTIAEAPTLSAVRDSRVDPVGPAPNSLTVNRGENGIAEIVESIFSRDEVATDSAAPAPVALTAPRIVNGAQGRTGPTLSRMTDAKIAKSAADAQSPSARAAPAEIPTVAGSEKPNRLTSSASAADNQPRASSTQSVAVAAPSDIDGDASAENFLSAQGVKRTALRGQPQIVYSDEALSRPPSNRAGSARAVAARVEGLPRIPALTSYDGDGAPDRAGELAVAAADGPARKSTESNVAFPQTDETPNGPAIEMLVNSKSPAAKSHRELPGLSANGAVVARKTRPPESAFDAGHAPPLAESAPRTTTNSTQDKVFAAPAGDAEVGATGVRGDDDRGQMSAQASLTPIDGEQLSGLGATIAANSGLPDRLARRESEIAITTPTRFIKKKTTGRPTIQGAARQPAPAFAKRARRGDQPASSAPRQPTEKTEAAIELGLSFLAKWQAPDGRWALNRNGVDLTKTPRERPRLESDSAATGLALLAFLGAGYDHFGDGYQDTIGAGLNFLVRSQKPSGELYIPGDPASSEYAQFYSHGIATIALCEAFGMTGDPELAEPAQRAIDFIVASQDSRHGGWRYAPDTESDLSVTGWQVMALKSGELAGLNVPDRAYDRAARFIHSCREQGSDASRFVYHPNAPKSQWRQPSTVMTSVGLLTSLYLGESRDDRAFQRGADHLLANLPRYNESRVQASIGTIGNPGRDTYYWYYATQVMFHMRGDHWRKWNERLHPLLVNTQTQTGPLAGSWNPFRATASRDAEDRWASHGGRLYVTAMNLLSLEVYYRHLPLHDVTAE